MTLRPDETAWLDAHPKRCRACNHLVCLHVAEYGCQVCCCCHPLLEEPQETPTPATPAPAPEDRKDG